EAIAAVDVGGKPLGLGTNLGAFNVAFGDVAVDLVPGAEDVLAGGDHSFGVGWFEQEVDDAQAESEVVGAGLRVEERASSDARDIPRGGDRGAVVAGFDCDPATGGVGAAGAERQRRPSLVLDADQRLRLPGLSHGAASGREVGSAKSERRNR